MLPRLYVPKRQDVDCSIKTPAKDPVLGAKRGRGGKAGTLLVITSLMLSAMYIQHETANAAAAVYMWWVKTATQVWLIADHNTCYAGQLPPIAGAARKKARTSGDGDGVAATDQAAAAKKPRKGQTAAGKRGGKQTAPARSPQQINLNEGDSDGGSDLSGRPLAMRVVRAGSVLPLDRDAERRNATDGQARKAGSQPGAESAGNGHAAANRAGADPPAAVLTHTRGCDGVTMPHPPLSLSRKDDSGQLRDAGMTTAALNTGGDAVPTILQQKQCSSPLPQQSGHPVISEPPLWSPCAGRDIVVPPTPESQVELRTACTFSCP